MLANFHEVGNFPVDSDMLNHRLMDRLADIGIHPLLMSWLCI